jgi:hypothetical protein
MSHLDCTTDLKLFHLLNLANHVGAASGHQVAVMNLARDVIAIMSMEVETICKDTARWFLRHFYDALS